MKKLWNRFLSFIDQLINKDFYEIEADIEKCRNMINQCSADIERNRKDILDWQDALQKEVEPWSKYFEELEASLKDDIVES